MRFLECLTKLPISLSVVLAFTATVMAGEIPVPEPSPRNTVKPEVEQKEPLLPRTFDADLECEKKLKAAGARFELIGDVPGENGCGFPDAVNLVEIVPGISLEPDTQFRCDTALALTNWVNHSVLPAVKAFQLERGAGKASKRIVLKSLKQGSSYACRRRNNLATGKLSEHAIGTAIDILGFEFEGREPLNVQPRAKKGTMDAAFQSAVRSGACLFSTTVLGPGSDGYHKDHLHLDIAQRRNNYRLCN